MLSFLLAAVTLAGQPSSSAPSGATPAPAATPAASAAPAITTKKIANLTYATPEGSKPLLIDLYLPEPSGKPVPVVLWVHGGGWMMGDKEWCPAAYLVPKGYAAASISYRFTQVAPFPAQLHDCKAAVRWLREHAKEYNLDADHIGVWGASAGGHLVALLGLTNGDKEVEGEAGGEAGSSPSSAVQCVVDWFGPMDLRYVAKPGVTDDGANGMVTALVGGTGDLVAANATLASPITHVSKDDVPFLIMHGDKDTLVELRHSEMLDKALHDVGVESTLVVLPGAGHGGKQFGEPKVIQQITEFFEKHLKPAGNAASAPEPASGK